MGDTCRQTGQVGCRLSRHATERRGLRFGLDHAHGLAVSEQQVVGKARFQGELAHGPTVDRANLSSPAVGRSFLGLFLPAWA